MYVSFAILHLARNDFQLSFALLLFRLSLILVLIIIKSFFLLFDTYASHLFLPIVSLYSSSRIKRSELLWSYYFKSWLGM